MKHRLASQGPTGHLWPSFTILLLLSSFCYREISGVPPSLSSFYLGILEERLTPRLGWASGGITGGGGGWWGGVYHYLPLKAKSGGGGRKIKGVTRSDGE